MHEGIVFSCFLTLSLYHLFIFSGRKKDYKDFFWAIILIGFAGNIFITNIYPLYSNPASFMSSITLIFTHISVCGLFFLFYSFVDLKKRIKRHFNIIIILLTILNFVCTFLDMLKPDFLFFRIYFLTLSIVSILYLTIITIRIVQWRDRVLVNQIIFISYYLLVVFYSIYSFLIFRGIVLSFWFNYGPILLFSLLFSYLLVSALNSDHKNLNKLKENLENEIKEKTLELYEKEKYAMQGKLISGIAHEIINPLSNILAPIDYLKLYLGDMKELKDDEKIKKQFNNIEKGIKRINNIINNIRNLYTQRPTPKKRLSMNNIIKEIVDSFNKSLDEDISLRYRIKEELYILGHYDTLFQILINLVSNAIDAIKGNGEVCISAEKLNENFIIMVSDNGRGIKKEDIPYIFNAFFTKKNTRHGTGLGLYIVKELIIKMEWKIDVKSDVSQGTNFIITIKKHN